MAFERATVICGGGKRYLGFSSSLRPQFDFFLSCGIPGKIEGERYKKSPELVRKLLAEIPPFEAPGKYIIFKRWDSMEADDLPEAVIFSAPPDVLSGLFTLANFDHPDLNGVIAPFGAGCASIVAYPFQENQSPNPRAVLGMFDVSARPCVSYAILSITYPWKKFVKMVKNMDVSFLTTASWEAVRQRMPSRR